MTVECCGLRYGYTVKINVVDSFYSAVRNKDIYLHMAPSSVRNETRIFRPAFTSGAI